MKKYGKPHRFKKKKSVLRNRFFGLGILIFLLIGAVLYFLFFSGFFQIEKVVFFGQEKTQKEILDSFIPRVNIFLINTDKTEEEILLAFPQITKVEIQRKLPKTINIAITERIAVAVWCLAEECFHIDKEGTAFEKASPEADFVKLFGKKELLNKENISWVLEAQSRLKEELEIEVEIATLVSPQRLDLKTLEGWEIYFDLSVDSSWQIQKLGLVLEKQIPRKERGSLEYIDLRFSRIYYK